MLSIIVPVYNVEKYINQCLDSLVSQTYKDIEIVLVDDGSTDTSGIICDEYAQNYDTVKVIHKENGGPASAYLRGLAECKGEYIGFVDSDDWIEPDMYEKMMSHFGTAGVNLVTCKYDKVFDADATSNNSVKSDGKHTEVKIYDRSNLDEVFFDNATSQSLFSLSRCNKVYLKSDIEKIIPYLDSSVSFVEDNLFNLLYATKQFNKACAIDDVMYHYRYNPNSNSTRMSDKKFDDMNCVYEKLKESDKDGQYLRKFNGAYVVTCFIALSSIIKSNADKKEKIKQIKQVLSHRNLAEAQNNCEWKCSNFAQRVKKFLVKHKMARTYLFLYKIAKL